MTAVAAPTTVVRTTVAVVTAACVGVVIGVMTSVVDQCMHGLTARDPSGKEKPAMKPTGFLSNSSGIADELEVRCDG